MKKMEKVTACIVTRGDHDLDEIYFSLADADIPLIKVWDNSKRDTDLSVYGRYALVEETDSELIYVQDDDCVLPPEAIQYMVGTYPSVPRDGWPVLANQPEPFRHEFYSDHCLVGFGAVFHRDAPKRAFDRFEEESGDAYVEASPLFQRTCDIVFTGLTPRVLVDVPYANLPWATDESRMYRQHELVGERFKMLDLVRKVRDGREP